MILSLEETFPITFKGQDKSIHGYFVVHFAIYSFIATGTFLWFFLNSGSIIRVIIDIKFWTILLFPLCLYLIPIYLIAFLVSDYYSEIVLENSFLLYTGYFPLRKPRIIKMHYQEIDFLKILKGDRNLKLCLGSKSKFKPWINLGKDNKFIIVNTKLFEKDDFVSICEIINTKLLNEEIQTSKIRDISKEYFSGSNSELRKKIEENFTTSS